MNLFVYSGILVFYIYSKAGIHLSFFRFMNITIPTIGFRGIYNYTKPF